MRYEYYVYVVILLVEFLKQSRPRGDTVRPAMSLPANVWNLFYIKYTKKEVRDEILTKLITLQIEDNVV